MTLRENPVHYFVYYRIREDLDHDIAHNDIRTMQAELEQQTGVTGRLMIRIHDDATWMEIYENIFDAEKFELALQTAVDTHGLIDLVEPGAARHIERFSECV